jgi:hypothetical protein
LDIRSQHRSMLQESPAAEGAERGLPPRLV